MSAFIKFNVGGESFQTTEETLLSEPNSLFHHILNGSWGCEKDSSGAILLDRDPRYFRPLLNYLRTRQIVLDEGVSPEGVCLEAEYFMVHSALDAFATHMDQTQQLVAMVVDARPGKLVNIRMGLGTTPHGVLPETPISFLLKREAIVSLTLECAASENVNFMVEDAHAPSAEFIVHTEQGRSTHRAIAWLSAGPHALSVRCRSSQVGEPGIVHGPARLEVWRYPTELATWRKALDINGPGAGAELLECGDAAAVRGGFGVPHRQDATALADAIRAIAASAYA